MAGAEAIVLPGATALGLLVAGGVNWVGELAAAGGLVVGEDARAGTADADGADAGAAGVSAVLVVNMSAMGLAMWEATRTSVASVNTLRTRLGKTCGRKRFHAK
jgi:hypothetical protein